MGKPTILVLGAAGPAGANFIDSLFEDHANYRIIAADSNRYHLSQVDLAQVDKTYLLPQANHESHWCALASLIKEEGVEFIHAQPDPEVLKLSEYRQVLDGIGVRVLLPSEDALLRCADKMALTTSLQAAGVPVANSYLVPQNQALVAAMTSLNQGRDVWAEKLWLRARRGAGSRAAAPMRTPAQAAAWMDYWQEFKGISWDDFMISEFLPGREFAWQSIWKDGFLVSSVGRERLEYLFANLTVSGQSSSPTVARTVHDARVNQIATAAVEAIDKRPNGIYCVDLKENKQGIPCVTEINAGRFYTTSYFITLAGENMPKKYVDMAFGKNVSFNQYDAVPENLYWIRQIDMMPALVKGEENWKTVKDVSSYLISMESSQISSGVSVV